MKIKFIYLIFISNLSYSQNSNLGLKALLTPNRNYKQEQELRNREIEFQREKLKAKDRDFEDAERIADQIQIIKNNSTDLIVSGETNGCKGIRKYYFDNYEKIANEAKSSGEIGLQLLQLFKPKISQLYNNLKLFECEKIVEPKNEIVETKNSNESKQYGRILKDTDMYIYNNAVLIDLIKISKGEIVIIKQKAPYSLVEYKGKIGTINVSFISFD